MIPDSTLSQLQTFLANYLPQYEWKIIPTPYGGIIQSKLDGYAPRQRFVLIDVFEPNLSNVKYVVKIEKQSKQFSRLSDGIAWIREAFAI
jgi:hypothetical protein